MSENQNVPNDDDHVISEYTRAYFVHLFVSKLNFQKHALLSSNAPFKYVIIIQHDVINQIMCTA